MKDDSFIIPLVLDSRQETFFDEAFRSTEHSAITSWGLGDDDFRDPDVPPGVAIGCSDGSVFIFHAQEVKKNNKKKFQATLNLTAFQSSSPSVRRSTSSRSSSPLPSPGSASSKSPSKGAFTSLHPITQPARSRIVSGLSTTPAEAPKNYVDFEPEKDRLEGILRSSSSKNKSLLENLKSSHINLSTGRLSDPNQAGHKRYSRTAPPSRSGSPRNSLSSPPSPTLSGLKPFPTQPVQTFPLVQANNPPLLKLKYHVYPCQFIPDSEVTALRYLTGGLLLALLKSGTIYTIAVASGLCMASVGLDDLPYLQPPPSNTTSAFLVRPSDTVWNWTELQAIETSEYTIVMAIASNSVSITTDKDPGSHSRFAILQLVPLRDPDLQRREGILNKVGEWMVENDPYNFYLFKDDYTSVVHLLYIESNSLLSQTLEIVPEAYTIAAPESLQPPAEAISSALVAPPPVEPSSFLGPIPIPFKLKEENSQSRASTPKMISGRVLLGLPTPLGNLPVLEIKPSRMKILDFNAKMVRGCIWNEQEFYIFRTVADSKPKMLGHMYLRQPVDTVNTTPKMLYLKGDRHIRAFPLPEAWWDTTEDTVLEMFSSVELTTSTPLVAILSPSYTLCAGRNDFQESISLKYLPFIPSKSKHGSRRSEHSPSKPKVAWTLCEEASKSTSNRITALLPIDNDLILVGDSSGSIHKSSLANLMSIGLSNATTANNDSLDAYITSLHLLKIRGEDLVIGGLDDGGIAVWQLRSLKLSMRRTVFLEPLSSVLSMHREIETLKDCILCISGDGTVVAINVVNFELLYTIPGSATHLTEICLSEDNILLMYADGMSRMWDLKTQEFWRSMATRTASELLSQGGWHQYNLSPKQLIFSPTSLTALPNSWISYDAGATILCDLHALSDLMYPVSASYQFKDRRIQDSGAAVSENEPHESPILAKRNPVHLRHIRSLIAALITPGLDKEIDRVCRDKLGIHDSKTTIGVYWFNCISISDDTPSAELWQLSPVTTASRLLALIALLRALSNFEGCERYANEVITFYVAALPDIIGQIWQSPSLEFLARYWFHHSQDIRMAARTLFGSAIVRQSDADIISLTEFWQHELPCLQPDAEKQSDQSALALLITGNAAIERYSILSTSTLTDIAKSLTFYLNDEECPHRGLAIDLCSRGFPIWQNYVDAVEVLRSLFHLATSADKERNVGPQARSAVLQIASNNTPLFITTLLLDILHPKTLQHRKSILQLVAFLIRKKPLVLYPNLPRLVEAVVKSLDPSASGERNAVFDAATEILAQVVKFFPSADFHMATQRLCVGTSEGAVVMYDLKTATRLYVLEGHKKQIDICSFSPDGRRLVTVSVEEKVAKVWKVGSSFVSLFTPGVPPRQGHSGSDPYKSVPFNPGEVNLSTAAIFEHVQIEWPGERNARLKIKEIAFTFST